MKHAILILMFWLMSGNAGWTQSTEISYCRTVGIIEAELSDGYSERLLLQTPVINDWIVSVYTTFMGDGWTITIRDSSQECIVKAGGGLRVLNAIINRYGLYVGNPV